MNSPGVLLNEAIQHEGAWLCRRVNERMAELLGINPAARLTTSKPSGNASVLLGTSSGVQGEHAERYIRNVQITDEQPVCEIMKRTNPYMIEKSVWSAGDTDHVISFPIIADKNSIFKADLTGTSLMRRVLSIQKNWIEQGTVTERCVDPSVRHNVSHTVVVGPDEWNDVVHYL